MPEGSDDQRAHCHACGHLISGPVRTYRCPKCGSYDVALIPLPHTGPRENATRRLDPATPIKRVSPFKYLFPRPPKGMPKALWVNLRPLRLLVYPVLVAEATFLITNPLFLDLLTGPTTSGSPQPALSRSPHLWALVMLELAAFVMILFPHLAKRRLRRFERDVVADNSERCLECGYPLKGLPEAHRCPECGEWYHIDAVRETWKRYFDAQEGKR